MDRHRDDPLDERERLVAIWHVAGFTVAQIAAYLACTPSEVDAMLYRLRQFAITRRGRRR
ncbi:helix-turn-helix domain-containing protein [Luteitalea sp.]